MTRFMRSVWTYIKQRRRERSKRFSEIRNKENTRLAGRTLNIGKPSYYTEYRVCL